jgi:WD40 repeat protein
MGHVQLVDLNAPASVIPEHASSSASVTPLSSSPTTFMSSHIPESAAHHHTSSSMGSSNAVSDQPISNIIRTLQTSLIAAHTTPLSSITLNHSGTMLATTSAKGTLIRVFDTASGRIIRELRRGADHANIYSVAFSTDSKWLCCGSDKGTVHVYSLEVAAPPQDVHDYATIPSPGISLQQSNRHSSYVCICFVCFIMMFIAWHS